MTDTVAVHFANEAFYAAFTAGDDQAMNDVWSRTHPVTCIHPGWGPLTQREAVMESWRAILSSGGTAGIRFVHPTVRIIEPLAYVLCFEVIGSSSLVATNIFVREGSVWRMVHHQAGPAQLPDGADEIGGPEPGVPQ